MSPVEYHIVSGVFGATLPYRARILVTDAAGMDGRAFTIPTSLVSTLLGMAPGAFMIGAAVGGYLGSFLNLAYLMNVGADYDTLGTSQQRLLVHETTHVWQGKNSTLALTYVFSSVINQGLYGGSAYSYTAGQPWRSYNAEQQALVPDRANTRPSAGDADRSPHGWRCPHGTARGPTRTRSEAPRVRSAALTAPAGSGFPAAGRSRGSRRRGRPRS